MYLDIFPADWIQSERLNSVCPCHFVYDIFFVSVCTRFPTYARGNKATVPPIFWSTKHHRHKSCCRSKIHFSNFLFSRIVEHAYIEIAVGEGSSDLGQVKIHPSFCHHQRSFLKHHFNRQAWRLRRATSRYEENQSERAAGGRIHSSKTQSRGESDWALLCQKICSCYYRGS